jgi:hypothetical protein
MDRRLLEQSGMTTILPSYKASLPPGIPPGNWTVQLYKMVRSERSPTQQVSSYFGAESYPTQGEAERAVERWQKNGYAPVLVAPEPGQPAVATLASKANLPGVPDERLRGQTPDCGGVQRRRELGECSTTRDGKKPRGFNY